MGNDCKIYDLNEEDPKEIWFLEDTQRFGQEPEYYIETGFNLIFEDEQGRENLIQTNDTFTAYMVANNSDEQNGVIYKCCDEIDL